MRKIIITTIFFALQICNKLQAQNPNGKKYDSVFVAIKEFILTNLDYERLNSISCNSSGSKFMVLEFKVTKKHKFFDVDIKNDSLKELTQIFGDAVELMETKLPLEYFSILKKKQIFIPILYGNLNCKENYTESKLHNEGLSYDSTEKIKNERFEFSRQMQQQFVKVINSINNLFSNTGSPRVVKNAVIFPYIFVFDDPKSRVYK